MRSSILGVFAVLINPTADAFINISPSTLSLAKKVRIEFELDLPDGTPDISSLEQKYQAIQAWKLQTAEDYPYWLQGVIRSGISKVQEVANNEDLIEVKQQLESVSKDYNKAITEPYQKLVESWSDLQPEIESAKEYNSQVLLPRYNQIVTKVFSEQTYVGAKENNLQAAQGYKSALTKTYTFLQDVYPKETIASAVAQQKVNNEAIVRGYNQGFTKLFQALQPTQEALEKTQDLAIGYKQFLTQAYSVFDTVAAPVAEQTNEVIQAAKVANVNLESQYKDFVTTVYQDSVRPSLQTASRVLSEAYTTASTDGLEQTKAAQADALVKYNELITETYIQLVKAYDESGAGPVLGELASKLQGQLDDVAAQVTINLPSFVQSQIMDDFALRMDVSSMIQVLPTSDAVANAAAQYQHFVVNNLQAILNSAAF